MELLQAVPPNPEGDPVVITWMFILFIAFLIVIYWFVIKAHKDSANRFPMPNPNEELIEQYGENPVLDKWTENEKTGY